MVVPDRGIYDSVEISISFTKNNRSQNGASVQNSISWKLKKKKEERKRKVLDDYQNPK